MSWPGFRLLLHDTRQPIEAVQADHLARQVDPSTRFDLVRRDHFISSCGFRDRLSSRCSPFGLLGSRTGPD
jgi:hypothetical protein